jgi:D-alanyl-lipoteichoic acid acyltransferase DltB (MBOAT superfamily)
LENQLLPSFPTELFVYTENSPLLFTQAIFWVLFGAVILVYQLVYSRNTFRNLFLLAFSLYFYYLSSGFYFSLLLFSTAVDYYLGNAIFRSNDPRKRKRLVATSVAVNLGVLGYFKYTYFFISLVNGSLGTDWPVYNILAALPNLVFDMQLDTSSIFLPVGISFYTFQTISYSVDIYRRQLEPVKNIWDFGFYVSFFPQLVAGPIVRASDFVPQIYQKYHLTQEEFGRATFLIINGLVKKILISDYLSINFVDRVFQAPASYSGFENLMAVYGYGLQIYCDFSGYTDIAIGISLLLGFRLPPNFNSPYKATNITDFWRRWHISLSSWLRDYLYISMGGNRNGQFRTYLNLMLTMLLGGLWHGAHLRFIVWGGLHGLALAFHKVWMEVFKPASGQKPSLASSLISGFITFHFVCFCWIYFRADSFALANLMIFQIMENFNPELIATMVVSYKEVFLVMLLGYTLHWLPASWKDYVRQQFIVMPDFAKAVVAVAIALLLFQFKSAELQPFIYFQF